MGGKADVIRGTCRRALPLMLALAFALLAPVAGFAQPSLSVTGSAGLMPDAANAPEGGDRFTADEDTSVMLVATSTGLVAPVAWQWTQSAEDRVQVLGDAADVASSTLSLDLPNWGWDHEITLTVTATAAGGATPAVARIVVVAVSNRNGICDRTPAVQEELLYALSDRDDCAAVTPADLAAIEGEPFLFGLVEILSILNSGVGELRPYDFAGLTSLRFLDLRTSGLKTLPPGLFDDLISLEYLYLGGNRLSSLPAGSFAALTSLKQLSFSDNALRSLAPGLFAGLTSLEALRLSNNNLSTLPAGVFSGLPSLRQIILNQNDISSLPPGVFADLPALEQIHLNQNRVRSLPAGLFASLPALTGLFLSDNDELALSAGTFDGAGSLRYLDMNGSGLRSLPPEVFSGLVSLERLSLHENELAELPPDIFSGLASLEVLHLYDNELRSLPPGIFAGLASLEQLTLSGNDLVSLPPGVFSGLTSLSVLFLHNNHLEALPPGLFAELNSLRNLYLYSNALRSLPPDLLPDRSVLLEIRLEDNELVSLPPDLFQGAGSLRTIRLENNALRSLPPGLFEGLRTLEYLYLSDNELETLPPGIFDGLYLSVGALDINRFQQMPEGLFTGIREGAPPRVTGLGLDTFSFHPNPKDAPRAHPFTVTLEAAEDTRAVVVRVAQGVPARTWFTLSVNGASPAFITVPLGGDRATLPVSAPAGATVTLAAGRIGEPAYFHDGMDFAYPSQTLTLDAGQIRLSVSPEALAEDAGATTVTVTARFNGGALAEALNVPVTLSSAGRAGIGTTPTAGFTVTIPAGATTTATGTFTLTPTADADAYGGDGRVTVSGTHPTFPVSGATVFVRDTFEAAVSVSGSAGLTLQPDDPSSEAVRFTATEDTTARLTASSVGLVSGVTPAFMWSQAFGDPVWVLTPEVTTDAAVLNLAFPNRSANYTVRLSAAARHDPGTAALVRTFGRDVIVEVSATDSPPIIEEVAAEVEGVSVGDEVAVSPGTQVRLRGRASDEDIDQRLRFEWSGPVEVPLSRADAGRTAMFTAPDTAGRRTFTFSVDDGDVDPPVTEEVVVEVGTELGVSIRALSPSPVTEGDDVRFEVTASGTSTMPLSVNVSLSGAETFWSGDSTRTVEIGTGSTTAILTVRTEDDQEPEDLATLMASIAAGTGYVAVAPAIARVALRDNEPSPDVNRDDAVNANDALILYYAYSLRSNLGSGR